MILYRVLPFDPNAAQNEPGGVFFIPRQSTGRIANPDLYQELYLCDHAIGATAERFGRLATWRASTLRDRKSGLVLALAAYELPDLTPICDLDDPQRLQELGLTPSAVVSDDRRQTQAWAREIYAAQSSNGLRWWSPYNASWHNYALWNITGLHLAGAPERLSLNHRTIVAASKHIHRRIAT